MGILVVYYLRQLSLEILVGLKPLLLIHLLNLLLLHYLHHLLRRNHLLQKYLKKLMSYFQLCLQHLRPMDLLLLHRHLQLRDILYYLKLEHLLDF